MNQEVFIVKQEATFSETTLNRSGGQDSSREGTNLASWENESQWKVSK
jgi:hypothetical protein